MAKKQKIEGINSVIIQGIPYDVEFLPESQMIRNIGVEIEDMDEPAKPVQVCGNVDFNMELININDDLPATSKRVTLLHEILHACLYQIGYEDNERMIHALSYVLLDLMRKNKKLFQSLIEE